MLKMFIRHWTRDAVRNELYKQHTKQSRKALKGFNTLCRIDNWIRWLT